MCVSEWMCVCALDTAYFVFSTGQQIVWFQSLTQVSWKQLAGPSLPHLHLNFLILQPRAASFFPLFHVKFHLLSSLQMLLLVAVLKYLFIGWRWMVAVRRGRRIGAHHHMCHGNAWVATCHAVDPKALHTSWLLGNWKDEETVII